MQRATVLTAIDEVRRLEADSEKAQLRNDLLRAHSRVRIERGHVHATNDALLTFGDSSPRHLTDLELSSGRRGDEAPTRRASLEW